MNWAAYIQGREANNDDREDQPRTSCSKIGAVYGINFLHSKWPKHGFCMPVTTWSRLVQDHERTSMDLEM